MTFSSTLLALGPSDVISNDDSIHELGSSEHRWMLEVPRICVWWI